ncbi:hypothetical protein GCM10010254_06340 [Streptomyces chromofuscus]|nr:hypothetical protein GCM10010254_06340 [Streptomyces chromofuscus]
MWVEVWQVWAVDAGAGSGAGPAWDAGAWAADAGARSGAGWAGAVDG